MRESMTYGASDPQQDWRSTITLDNVCPCALCAVIAKAGMIGTWERQMVMLPPEPCQFLNVISIESFRIGTSWACK